MLLRWLKTFCLTGSGAIASVSRLFVSSYGGAVASLDLNKEGEIYTLDIVDTDMGCAPSPAWLTFDRETRILYCLDEGLFRWNGSLSSFKVSETGALNFGERKIIPSGPSSGAIYGDSEGKKLAISHYNGSALSTWNIAADSTMIKKEELFFYQKAPGPGPRQTAPHQHQVILDPTGQYLVSLAFGADEIQVFNASNPKIPHLSSHLVAPGSGPRHGAFWSPSGLGSVAMDNHSSLYLFVISEITSALTSFEIQYSSTGMNFTEVFLTNTYGGGHVPEMNGPAEIVATPENNFIIVSNRNGTVMPHASLEFGSSIEEYWDTLVTFAPAPDGSLALQHINVAGGGFPRNIALNRDGSMVAVASQSNHRVAILGRNITSGEIGNVVANVSIIGEPNCVAWDD